MNETVGSTKTTQEEGEFFLSDVLLHNARLW